LIINERNYSSLIYVNMWFLSRCISVDALNSCFPQQRSRMSYDFNSMRNRIDLCRRRWDMECLFL